MKHFRIKSWGEYQHYKDRSPPWIKLHREMKNSRVWVRLDSRGRELMVLVMMLAAETENKIPMDPDYIKRVGYLDKVPDLTPLFDLQFIEMIEDGANDTECTQMLANRIPSVSVSDSISLKGGAGENTDPAFESFWESFPRKRRGSKDEALRAWRKAIKKATAEEIMKGLEGYAASDEVERGYAKGTAAWLNAECWRNDYAPPKPGRGQRYSGSDALSLAMADTTRSDGSGPLSQLAKQLAATREQTGRGVLDQPALAALPQPPD